MRNRVIAESRKEHTAIDVMQKALMAINELVIIDSKEKRVAIKEEFYRDCREEIDRAVEAAK